MQRFEENLKQNIDIISKEILPIMQFACAVDEDILMDEHDDILNKGQDVVQQEYVL
jgi:hypothetical protein